MSVPSRTLYLSLEVGNGGICFLDRKRLEKSCYGNSTKGVILFLSWCTFVVPSFKNTALIFLAILFIQCFTTFQLQTVWCHRWSNLHNRKTSISFRDQFAGRYLFTSWIDFNMFHWSLSSLWSSVSSSHSVLARIILQHNCWQLKTISRQSCYWSLQTVYKLMEGPFVIFAHRHPFAFSCHAYPPLFHSPFFCHESQPTEHLTRVWSIQSCA